MAKKKKKPQKNKVSKLRFLKVFLLILLFSSLTGFSSYLIQNTKKNKEVESKKIEEKKKDVFKLEKIAQEKKKDLLKKEKNNKLEKKNRIEKKEKIQSTNITKKTPYKYDKKTKAKLAILIDDISSSYQKNKVLSIGYKVGMAFLPPTKNHKNSAKIAQDLPFYIIHFPMQASSKFKGQEKNTLHINDSYEKIEKRVKQLRIWYPKAKYTNNHTGSVFTSNEEAMDKLFRALKKYNFTFIDSKTSPKTLGKKYAKKYSMPYIVRNVFLDNKKEYKYIQNQLKKSIKIAKKQGYALAIGHPYPITIKVLKESKNLLKDLELIYVKELPYLLKKL